MVRRLIHIQCNGALTTVDGLTSRFTDSRPNFTRPPVIEVALAVQFEPLGGFDIPRIGEFWQLVRDELPEAEVRSPSPREVEQFRERKARQLQIELFAEPVTPRCWFKSSRGTELLQVQPDRLVFNWRQQEGDDQYPRYAFVRERFESYLSVFERYIADREIGAIAANQCAVTYINHIDAGNGWMGFTELDRVLTIWSGRHSDNVLPDVEDVGFSVRYRIPGEDGNPIGRLHVRAEPRSRPDDPTVDRVQLLIMARGEPLAAGTDGILSFLDLGREYVVRGFSSLTTPHMHAIWGRTDAK